MSFSSNSWGESTGTGGTGSTIESEPTFVAGEPKYLSKLPLFAMLGILSASVALLIAPLNSELVPVIGYLLTPFASIGMLAWGTAADSKLRLDVWYDRKVGILIAIRVIAAISFVVGLVHMWDVATLIARSAAGGIV